MNALLQKDGLLEGAKVTTGNFSLSSEGLTAQCEKQSLLCCGREKITVNGTDKEGPLGEGWGGRSAVPDLPGAMALALKGAFKACQALGEPGC